MSLLLLKQIFQLFIYILLGYILVRLRLIHTEDSVVLSKVTLYTVWPCVILDAFQASFSTDLMQGLVFTLALAIAIHIALLIFTRLVRGLLKLNPSDQASVLYSNIGLTIPIVISLVGREFVIFTSIYIMVQQAFIWTHCRMLLSGEKRFSIKNLININTISIVVGILLFLAQMQLPKIAINTITAFSNMFAPISMLVTGMLIGGTGLQKIVTDWRIWKTSLLRLIVAPLIVLLILKPALLICSIPNQSTIALVCFLAASSPAASAVTQLAQVYTPNGGNYAGTINIASTLLCIITMPLVISLL